MDNSILRKLADKLTRDVAAAGDTLEARQGVLVILQSLVETVEKKCVLLAKRAIFEDDPHVGISSYEALVRKCYAVERAILGEDSEEQARIARDIYAEREGR